MHTSTLQVLQSFGVRMEQLNTTSQRGPRPAAYGCSVRRMVREVASSRNYLALAPCRVSVAVSVTHQLCSFLQHLGDSLHEICIAAREARACIKTCALPTLCSTTEGLHVAEASQAFLTHMPAAYYAVPLRPTHHMKCDGKPQQVCSSSQHSLTGLPGSAAEPDYRDMATPVGHAYDPQAAAAAWGATRTAAICTCRQALSCCRHEAASITRHT